MVEANFHEALKTKLYHRLLLANKHAEAIDYVIREKNNPNKIKEEIRRNEIRLSARTTGQNGDGPNKDGKDLEQAYVEQLKACLEIVQRELKKWGSHSDQITGLLHKLAVVYDATGDAIQFALDTEINIDVIARKMDETEKMITNPPEELVRSLQPGTSPGIYKRNYLIALREIAQLIEKL